MAKFKYYRTYRAYVDTVVILDINKTLVEKINDEIEKEFSDATGFSRLSTEEVSLILSGEMEMTLEGESLYNFISDFLKTFCWNGGDSDIDIEELQDYMEYSDCTDDDWEITGSIH